MYRDESGRTHGQRFRRNLIDAWTMDKKAESSAWHGLSSKLAQTRRRGRSLIHIHRGGFMKWQEKELNTQIGLFVIQMFLGGRSNLIGWIKHEKGGAWSTGFLAKQPLTEPHCEGKTCRGMWGSSAVYVQQCWAVQKAFLSFFCYAENVSVVGTHSKHGSYGPEASAAVLCTSAFCAPHGHFHSSALLSSSSIVNHCYLYC